MLRFLTVKRIMLASVHPWSILSFLHYFVAYNVSLLIFSFNNLSVKSPPFKILLGLVSRSAANLKLGFTVFLFCFRSYLEGLCTTLYDVLRPFIIHINHLETLAEICSILRLEMLEEHVQNNREYTASFERYGCSISILSTFLLVLMYDVGDVEAWFLVSVLVQKWLLRQMFLWFSLVPPNKYKSGALWHFLPHSFLFNIHNHPTLWLFVSKWTILTERLPLGEVHANFCG